MANNTPFKVGLSWVVPAGTIVMFAGSTEPTGYKMCNGQQLDVDSYPGLYNVIGYSFGQGVVGLNGKAKFILPNFNGRLPIGTGRTTSTSTTRTLATTYGDNTITLGLANLPSHNHNVAVTVDSGGSHNHSINNTTLNASHNHSHNFGTSNSGSHYHNFTGSTGNSGSHTHSTAFRYDNTTGGNNTGQWLLGGNNGNGGSWITNAAGDHSHNVSGNIGNGGDHSHNINGYITNTALDLTHTHNMTAAGAHAHNVTANIGNTGSSTALDTTPASLCINFIIKT
jgi:microcystin-dependent protein